MTKQSTDIHAVLRVLAENFESTFGRGDAAGVADFYTENAMLLPTGSDFVHGKQDIEAYWQVAMDMGIKSIKLDILELEQHGDTAIEVSRYTLRSADGQVIDQGKGVVIWKNVSGTWKLHRDIWNSSVAEQ